MMTKPTYIPSSKILLGLLMFIMSIPVSGQDDEVKQKRTRHRIHYMNQADSHKYIQSYLYVSEKGVKTEIEGATIRFYAVSDTGEILIVETTTDENGKATAILSNDIELPSDSSGIYSFLAKYEGDEIYKAKDVDINVSDIKLIIEYLEEDSMKLIKVKASDPVTGNKIEDLDINFYVERMFLPLKISEESTDRKGIAELEFPEDLPGDTEGNVTIIVRIEDNDDYGNFIAVEDVSWGIPVTSIDTSHKRALWSPYAPIWMVITFIILMGLVWGHFVAIAVMMRLMKRDKESKHGKILWDA